VLIFYGWTAVASVGCLLYFVLPAYLGIPSWWATIFLGFGFLVCTALTLAPLSRRKAIEAVSQLAAVDTAEAEELAPQDPLDEAADDAETEQGDAAVDEPAARGLAGEPR
ncbi:MAG: hypothetical protein ABWX82_04555, partial [Leifsonia sp.]